MPFVEILTAHDPRLAPSRNLKATNATRWSEQFIVEGEKLVERLLVSEIRVCSILASRRYAERFRDWSESISVFVVPDESIDTLVGFNFHRGVLACAVRPEPADLGELCAPQGGLTLVVCPAVQDPENLGAILRISAAFGVAGLILGRDCCDPFSRRVLRVSMGAALRVPMRVSDNLAAELQELRDKFGVQLWATVADRQAARLDQVERPQRLALLMGNEGHGLAERWLAQCDARITIPISSGVDSLNVATAAGIILYGLTR